MSQKLEIISAFVILIILIYVLNILKVTYEYDKRQLQKPTISYVIGIEKEEQEIIRNIYDCPALLLL